jgi:hypothetical protein
MTLAAALLVFAAVIVGLRTAPLFLIVADRYYSLPVALLLWSALLCVRRHPAPATAVLAMILAATAGRFVVPPLPDLEWRSASRCLDTRAACAIPINPAGWRIELPAR